MVETAFFTGISFVRFVNCPEVGCVSRKRGSLANAGVTRLAHTGFALYAGAAGTIRMMGLLYSAKQLLKVTAQYSHFRLLFFFSPNRKECA